MIEELDTRENEGDFSPLKSLEEERVLFEHEYPTYLRTAKLDELRRTEYARIDRLGHIYLDYTGGGLYSENQVKIHSDMLLNQVFGNPHSSNPTSQAMTHLVNRARASVLAFFRANPEEYV